MNKLPSKIEPDNILQSVAQIRFKSNLMEEARIGTVIQDILTKYPKVTSLAANNIPPDILKNDKSLEFTPLYSFSNESESDIVIEIGYNVVSIFMNNKYSGWNIYQKHIKDVIDIVIDKLQIIEITRIGLSYVYFYPSIDVFDNLKIKINNDIENIQTSQYVFFITSDDFTSMIECRNDGLVNGKAGSIINLDSYKTENISNDTLNIMELFNNAHIYQKEIYFCSLMSDQYLKTLKVEY